ncbi:MAG: HEPN domain-containing protein [Chloroflexota bacterium]
MDVDKVVHYWTESADEDWSVTRHLFDSGAYQYALFFAHLFLEKLLKAIVVRETGNHAPRTHNLLFLAERARLSLSPERREVLLRVTAYNISTRYPEDIAQARQRYTREFTENELQIVEETGQWLKSQLSQKKP